MPIVFLELNFSLCCSLYGRRFYDESLNCSFAQRVESYGSVVKKLSYSGQWP
ncbi:hypothetical protein Patl1_37064 [Pistacia atlantica]|nr:hypothetical protein Patl1_37064 [Pistacia atlantica]